ncbi:MAG: ATP-binding protein, partial [Parabacteroides sp.]|nr:ATP-binding protein [Parabacteroides sp.]
MRFYNREKELELLSKTKRISFEDHSQMTVLTGRRRIGKTKLILKSCENEPTVYLFVARSNEAQLCAQFAQIASKALNAYIPSAISTFRELFQMLMEIGKYQSYNLIIDEFQEFFNINPSVYSYMQDIWDRNKDITHVNLVASGSVYTLMTQIFQNAHEPLYGRCDSIMKIRPFSTIVLKEILSEHKEGYTSEDLLALFSFTGCVPKYIDLFMQHGCTDMESMVDYMVQPDSPFLNEGKALLVQEFGKKYGNYFAVLSDIANGKQTLPELESGMGDTSISGHLRRLEEDYELITKKRPILPKDGTQTVRFEITDLFLRFWFRYFSKYHYLIESEGYDQLKEI